MFFQPAPDVRGLFNWFVRKPANWLICLLLVCAATGYFAQVRAQRDSQPQLSPTALNQLQALIREKSARTPSQRKLDSPLLDTLKMRRGEAIVVGVPTLQTDVKVGADGKLFVVLTATNGAAPHSHHSIRFRK